MPQRDDRLALVVGEYREQHDSIEEIVLQDERGDRSMPWRVESLLERLEGRGDISAQMRQAGERFQALFHRAGHDPLRAADMSRVGGCGAAVQHRGSAAAADAIAKAMRALGGHGTPIGAAAWFVLGLDETIASWARREGWGGRPIREEVAKGIVIGSLSILASHWGLTSKSETL